MDIDTAPRELCGKIRTDAVRVGDNAGRAEVINGEVERLRRRHGGEKRVAAADVIARERPPLVVGRVDVQLAGNDYFLTAISFDEMKHYVRKVMNSYERYGAIYGSAPRWVGCGRSRSQP